MTLFLESPCSECGRFHHEAALKAWEGMHGSKGQSPKPSKVLTSIIINTALGLTEGDTHQLH